LFLGPGPSPNQQGGAKGGLEGDCSMNPSVVRSLVLYLFTLLACAGCGEGKPNLDDGAQLLIEARKAIQAGDKEAAMQLLDRSIAAKPYTWAYVERARLHGEQDNDEAARADVRAGLELEPGSSELKWIEKELKKPAAQRFKGPSPAAVK
jgi:hypothetical protein